MAEFLREQTREEEKEFKNIFDRKETLQERNKKALVTEESRCTKAHIPFCYKAASLKMKEEIDLHLQRIANGAEKAIPPSITSEWLKPFSDLKNFVLISKQEARDRVNVGITRENLIIGTHYDFLFKDTKYHVTVYVPTEETAKFEEYIKGMDRKI